MQRFATLVVAALLSTAIGLPVSAAGKSGDAKLAKEASRTSARSTVTAIAEDWVTVANADGTYTFQVDSRTHVIGSGLATIAREKQKTGTGLTTLPDLVGLNDQVIVSYRAVEGGLVASEIRVLGKRR
jgi:hypothetical protein